MDKINLTIIIILAILIIVGFVLVFPDIKILGNVISSDCQPDWKCVWGECTQESSGYYSYPECQDLNNCGLAAPEKKQCFSPDELIEKNKLMPSPKQPESRVTNFLFILGIILPIMGLVIIGFDYYKRKNIEQKPYLYQSQAA